MLSLFKIHVTFDKEVNHIYIYICSNYAFKLSCTLTYQTPGSWRELIKEGPSLQTYIFSLVHDTQTHTCRDIAICDH
jgi:hypothetical protein